MIELAALVIGFGIGFYWGAHSAEGKSSKDIIEKLEKAADVKSDYVANPPDKLRFRD